MEFTGQSNVTRYALLAVLSGAVLIAGGLSLVGGFNPGTTMPAWNAIVLFAGGYFTSFFFRKMKKEMKQVESREV